MTIIKAEDVILLHQVFEQEDSCEKGIRSQSLLESAIASAYQSAFGEDIFKEDIDKISRIGLGIIKNHPFIDANKRTSLAVIVTLCQLNDIKLPEENKLCNIILDASADIDSSWNELYEKFNLQLKLLCGLTTLKSEIYNGF